jgi:hypothetical protein
VAGRTGFEYHPLNGGRRPNKNASLTERVFPYGGEDRIRTCDRGFRPGNRLAGGPIRPLWHLPNIRYVVATFLTPSVRTGAVAFVLDDSSRHCWRREWDSNPRWLSPNMFSRHAPSAARSSLQGSAVFWGGSDFTIRLTWAIDGNSFYILLILSC